jgi:hypothetical protein
MSNLNRRRVLRGLLDGGAITVGLPLLNCFLNGNGNALANGAPMPIRYGTWFWGLGMSKSVFVPKKVGTGYDLPEELTALKNVRDDVNLITNLVAYRDGAFFCHFTGWVVFRTGTAPVLGNQAPSETLDVIVANQIGRTTRFKSLTTCATGDVRTVVSYENANTPNSPEFSPLNFYTRLFGPDFQDPNASAFAPNPRIMARKSALSAVTQQIKLLNTQVGAEDKARLDQYFTGLRHLEQQFDHQLTKPEPLAACHPAKGPKEDPKLGNSAELVAARHNMMTDLLVMAVACDQTRVFNMAYSNASANTTKPGYEKPHHTTTHEEPSDERLGYQPNASWFLRRSMESWAYYVDAFKKVKEGDGTLLDNCLIMANTDVSNARVHSLTEMPSFTAGRAGGKVKTGQHIDGKGGQGTSLGYTTMKLMGLDIPSWGTKSNQTNKVISEMLA